MISRLLDALDTRTGWRALLRAALDEPVPGGARFVYAFGSLLVGLLLLQALTGVALAAHYVPATTGAWASVVHFEDRVLLGRFVRGLHTYGATAIIVALALHYAQVVWLGAYKAPREVNWLLGLALALVVLALGFTGYLLPWDQKGYWATKVGVGIAAATPFLGEGAARVLQGGGDLSTLTLTRFYALHAIVLPWLLVALAAAHLALFRRHGLTTPPEVSEGATVAKFFPSQVWKDALLVAGAFAVVAGLSLARGADLEAPADPASDYLPRPEWYFLPLFQLLKFFPGRLEAVGSIGVPGVVLLLLAALPWLDRGASRRPKDRALPLAIAFGPLVVAAALGGLAALADAGDPKVQAKRHEAEREARLARRLAKDGVPTEGPLALLDRHPPRLGRRTFEAHCASCHVVGDQGKPKGPFLTGYLSHDWLKLVIRTPNDPRLFGQAKFDEGMGALEATPQEVSDLATYVKALEGKDVEARLAKDAVLRGKALFVEQSCGGCHEVVPGKTGDGPNLHGYGSAAWLKAFLLEPGAKVFYAARNKMPAFKGKLTEAELDAVVVYLKGLERGAGEDE